MSRRVTPRAYAHVRGTSLVHEGLNRGTWIYLEHEGLGREVIVDDVRTLVLLHFVENTPAFLGLVRKVPWCAV